MTNEQILKLYDEWNDTRTTEYESDLESWLYEQGYDEYDVAYPLQFICGYKAGQESSKCCGTCKWIALNGAGCKNINGLYQPLLNAVCKEREARP